MVTILFFSPWQPQSDTTQLYQCSVFNLPFQIAIYTRVITATMLFLQFNFVVILRWLVF